MRCGLESVKMDRWVGKVAVVTGTSSGIGTAIAKALVIAGLKVVGLARRKNDELINTLSDKKGQFFPRCVDLTNEEKILETFKWIKEDLGPIHILINNAGIRHSTTLIDGETQDWKNTLDLNVLALCIMTREAIKNMRENQVDGHIVHINSLAGHRIPPALDNNLYPASKYAVTALTETLRQELNSLNLNIKVSSISPGLVRTNMISSASEEQRKQLGDIVIMEPEDIADAVVFVLSTPPHVQIHELMLRPIGQPC